MAFIGEINHGAGLIASLPSGILAMVGEDTNHYVLANPSGEAAIQLDKIEGTPSTVWTRTQTEWRADLAGLSLGITGTASIGTEWGAPGTPYFFAFGYIAKTGYDEIVGIRYKIVDASTITADIGFRYSAQGFIGTFRLTPHCNGAGVIGTKCYAVCNTGGNLFDFNDTFKCHLIELPLDGSSVIDITSESWNSRITELPWEWGFLRALGSRPYYNRACVIPVDAGVRVDCYLGKTEVDSNGAGISGTIAALTGPSMLSTVVDPATHTHTGSNDVSSDYGLPWSDIGLTFAGGAGTARDDYTSPNYNADGKIRVGRGFSDSLNGRAREFEIDGDGNITIGAVTDFELRDTAIAAGQPKEFLQLYEEGGDLYWMVWADEYYSFGIIEDETETEEPDTEDEPDADTPCLFDWDECVLVPEAITVEVRSPTVSPGRSLTGRELVVQPEAGCLAVTLHGVKVWSNAELLLWREYESALNGRTGTCCVPLYEGKLSATPIVATLGAEAAIGAVRLTISQSAGATIRAGMHFQSGERAYRLVSGSGTAWKVYPPLRALIANGATLNFNDPRLRCRLERDDGMDIMLQHLRFGKQDVTFIEDV